jgi:glycosyltransferase involved in cell wall biosynthesis
MSRSAPFTVLHYTGAIDDRGGVMSVVHALAAAGKFECVLGVSPGFVQRRQPALPTITFPAIDAESLGWASLWRARSIAREASAWLAEEPRRIFHAHSRAALVVALWLARRGERRVVASVHCYGRHRWFYRHAARQLGRRLFWLSPAMKRYYGAAANSSWSNCIPGCVPSLPTRAARSRPLDGVLRLGGIGATVRWKRWHLIVEALAALPDEVRERVRFEHIGGPDNLREGERYGAELRQQTSHHGLDSIIAWRGEQASAAEFLAQIDCLVVASHNEPFSIAVLEALTAGVPVLAADSGGAQDLIVEGQSGWFFRSGDPASLAVQIGRLVTTDELSRLVVSEEGLRPFTAPVIAEQWERVYAGLCPPA